MNRYELNQFQKEINERISHLEKDSLEHFNAKTLLEMLFTSKLNYESLVDSFFPQLNEEIKFNKKFGRPESFEEVAIKIYNHNQINEKKNYESIYSELKYSAANIAGLTEKLSLPEENCLNIKTTSCGNFLPQLNYLSRVN